MADMFDIDLKWRMWLAQNGDRDPLAELLRDKRWKGGPLHPDLLEFFAAIIEGTIALKPRLAASRTFRGQTIQLELIERTIAEQVDFELSVRKWSKIKGTTLKNVRNHISRDGPETSVEAEVLRQAHRDRECGVQPRDKLLREQLTKELCRLYGVDIRRVTAYRKRGRTKPNSKIGRPSLREIKRRISGSESGT